MAQRTKAQLTSDIATIDTGGANTAAEVRSLVTNVVDSTHNLSDDGAVQVQPSEGAFVNGDKTKLDGIEASADVTDATNVAAAGGLLSGDIGTTVQGYDVDTLKADTSDQLTAGFSAAVDNDGTQSSGTYTPAFATGNYKRIVNGGAFTLAPPSPASDEAISIVVLITNNASAGAITTTGFSDVSGDSFTTTDGHDFMCFLDVVDAAATEYSSLTVKALQ